MRHKEMVNNRSGRRNRRFPLASRLRTEVLEDRRMLATFAVDSLGDELNNDISAGNMTLREAILLSNTTPGVDQINFASPLEGETIPMLLGEFQITDDVTISGEVTIDAQGNSRVFYVQDNQGLPSQTILDGLTLTGGDTNYSGGAIFARASLTVQNSTITGNDAAFFGGAIGVVSGQQANVTILDSTISYNTSRVGAIYGDGEVALIGAEIRGNTAAESGGAIYNRFGSVNVNDSVFLDNLSVSGDGGAIEMAGGSALTVTEGRFYDSVAGGAGGAIFSDGSVTLTQSFISRSSAAESGGAVRIVGNQPLMIDESTIVASSSGANGGGIFTSADAVFSDSRFLLNDAASIGGAVVLHGVSTITGSEFRDNEATSGGAIRTSNTTVIRDSTIYRNYATVNGGGVDTYASLQIVNSTISGNSANNAGGGLWLHGGHSATILHSTVFSNVASGGAGGGGIFVDGGSVTVDHTILAGNIDHTGNGPDIRGNATVRFTLVGDNTGSTLGDNGGNQLGTAGAPIDPLLGPLDFNRGSWTHALSFESPAVDAGDATFDPLAFAPALSQDQRGFQRVANDVIDIGAFERTPLIVSTAADEMDGNYDAGDFSLREALELANDIETFHEVTFDPALAGQTIALTMEDSLSIQNPMNLVGLGADQLTIDALGHDSVIEISAVGTEEISISGLTLTGGLNNWGGGVFAHSNGPLTLRQMVITDNTAIEGGGGINVSGQLNLVDSTIANNHAADGGGVILGYGHSSIMNTTISGNSAEYGGGGVSLKYSTGVTISHSTITGNTADVSGSGTGHGGGVFSTEDNTSVILDHTIVADNATDSSSPYVDLYGDGFSAESTLVGDTSATTIVDNGGNLLGSSMLPVDPMLSPLALHGGVTPTHRPLDGSPAIDAGSPSAMAGVNGVPEFDQRGAPFERVRAGAGMAIIDIGAVEVIEPLIVSTLADELDGDYSAGDFSFREALAVSNLVGGSNTISFAFLGEQTIELTMGSLPIESSVVISGPGSSRLTIDGRGVSRIFEIDNGVDEALIEVDINNLTLTAGSAADAGGAITSRETLQLTNVVISNSESASVGGAIAQVGGSLTLRYCTITGNRGTRGGGVFAQGEDFSHPVNLDVQHSLISGNTAAEFGGGVHVGSPNTPNPPEFGVTSTRVENNLAPQGAGLSARNAPLTIADSLISGNSATAGGGGGVSSLGYASFRPTDTLRMYRSTVDGNSAALGGGGIKAVEFVLRDSTLSANSADYGGGVSAYVGEITQSTISGNSASSSGGVYLYAGIVQFSTVANNDFGGVLLASTAGNAEVSHSILADNSGFDLLSNTPITTANYTLIEQPQFGLTVSGTGNLIGADPLLLPLGDNGGPTTTHALLAGSPARDAGDPNVMAGGAALQFDQRGNPFVRVGDGNDDLVPIIDIGAYEAELAGDFDFDGDLDVDDLDALISKIYGSFFFDSLFDLTEDGVVDLADRDEWLALGGAANLASGNSYLLGDANLDGTVDGQDFVAWNNAKFSFGALWSGGDFNADGTTDGQDFVIWNDLKFMSADEGRGQAHDDEEARDDATDLLPF